MPLFKAKKMKNCAKEATNATFIPDAPSSPVTAPPPRVLKNVTPLIMTASIIAFFQSNLCSTIFVAVFTEWVKKPLIVKVGRPKLLFSI